MQLHSGACFSSCQVDQIRHISAGTYPIEINSRNNLSPGSHVLALTVRDDLGHVAETAVNYELSESRVPANSEYSCCET